jgi:hypothetical protein
VGIAFQSLSGSDVENVGYVIPTPVVSHFLSDYRRNAAFTGFPALGVQWQRMESEGLRKAYHMKKEQKGEHACNTQKLRTDFVSMHEDGVLHASRC